MKLHAHGLWRRAAALAAPSNFSRHQQVQRRSQSGGVPPQSTRALTVLGVLATHSVSAATNTVAMTNSLPDVGGSVVRMLAGLAFVVALFFGGVWLFRNWQRVARVRSRSRLSIVEARSLGPRQALFVVGYDRQRFLVASSPNGVSLVSALPEATENEMAAAETKAAPVSFALLLQNALGRK